jgi:hypothetical protein
MQKSPNLIIRRRDKDHTNRRHSGQTVILFFSFHFVCPVSPASSQNWLGDFWTVELSTSAMSVVSCAGEKARPVFIQGKTHAGSTTTSLPRTLTVQRNKNMDL